MHIDYISAIEAILHSFNKLAVIIMAQLKKINMDEIWQKEQGWNVEKKSGRKYDDLKELEFWDHLAPDYSKEFNLYRDVEGLGDWIHKKFGDGHTVLDIGCGTGNFTIPMSSYSKEILALDFSPAMLKELSVQLQDKNIKNVRTVCSKWEDFHEPYHADYVLSVNSLYRVCYMRQALEKIVQYGTRGFVIVRTLLKPLLYDIYDDLQLNYRKNNDYMLMPMMLWDMGVHVDVKYTKYERFLDFANWEAAEKQMITDLGELSYLNYNNLLQEKFYRKVESMDNGFRYKSDRIVEIISYFKADNK